MTRQCADCRDGEHDNYDDDVTLCMVRNPETGKLAKRAYICGGHASMYLEDGYTVEEV